MWLKRMHHDEFAKRINHMKVPTEKQISCYAKCLAIVAHRATPADPYAWTQRTAQLGELLTLATDQSTQTMPPTMPARGPRPAPSAAVAPNPPRTTALDSYLSQMRIGTASRGAAQHHQQQTQTTSHQQTGAAQAFPPHQQPSRTNSGQNQQLAYNVLHKILTQDEWEYPIRNMDVHQEFVTLLTQPPAVQGQMPNVDKIGRLQHLEDIQRVGDHIQACLNKQLTAARMEASVLRKELEEHKLRIEALSSTGKHTLPVSAPTRQVRLKTAPPATQAQQCPQFGPYTNQHLEIFEANHVQQNKDTRTYPNRLFLRPNHPDQAFRRTMKPNIMAIRIPDHPRQVIDLSRAVCHGTTHQPQQPYELQGAHVIYRRGYNHKGQDKNMYWCSKCAAEGTTDNHTMRVGKNKAKTDKGGIFK